MTGKAAAGKLPVLEDSRQMRSISTPEGVVLPVELGQRGERAVAFILDILILFGAFLGIYLILILTLLSGAGNSGWLFSAVMLLSFFVRSFYFVFFELRWQGTTPGKRVMGLRVVARAGGPLRADAVLARNMMREIEFFVPLSLLLGAGGATGGWVLLIQLSWLGVFVLMPLFNRDGLRVGDMIAGTWVVATPKAVLLPDLSQAGPGEPGDEPRHGFSKAQLDAYGIYELQTLENVLRESGAKAREMRAEVARRIMKRIDWPQEPGAEAQTDRFLNEYYTALRGHLERKLLFGVRRRDKHDTK
ncbi:MAG: RDD family protein [Alphaproteobacteria bacterium]